MSFRTTENQQQSAADLASAARALAPEVTATFNATMARFLREGEKLPDLEFLQEIVSRWLLESGQQVLAIDDRYSAELRLQQELRARREQLVADLRQALRDVRYRLDRSFGEERSKGLFPDRNITVPRPVSLIRTGRQAIEVLRDPSLSWEQLAAAGLEGSPAALAATVENLCGELEQLLDRTIKEQKRLRLQRLGDKVAEIKAIKEAARRGANFLGGLYTLVGFDFQAKRLRLRRRKPAKSEKNGLGEPPPVAVASPETTPEVVAAAN